MGHQAARAARTVAVAVDVLVDAQVKQVVQGQPVVIRHRHTALQLARRACTAVIEAQRQPKRHVLLPLDRQIAFARLGIAAFGRLDLDIGLGRRYPLEVFQRLFRIAHTEQVAGPRWHRIPPGATAGRAGCKSNLAYASRYDAQGKRPLAQILRLGQYARGDIPTGNDGVLHAAHHAIDRLRAQTAPQRRVGSTQVVAASGGQYPLELLSVLAAQNEMTDHKTGRLAFRQAIGGHRRGRVLQAHIVAALLLLTQQALTFLLAYQFLAGIVTLAVTRCERNRRRDVRTHLRGHSRTQGSAKQKYTAP